MRLAALHRHPEYVKPCCELINEEWPRSETARLVSLQSSCDSLPTCLVLLSGEDPEEVVGHCKLTRIPSAPTSCFLESVVIRRSLRGRGLGTSLMSRVEEYCREFLGLETIHLSTKGQEEFYRKIGYEECPPISIYGGTSISYGKSEVRTIKSRDGIREGTKGTQNCRPPPPPPPPIVKSSSNLLIKQNKTFMMKVL